MTPISISSDGSVLWEAASLLGSLGRTTEEWGGRHDGGRRKGRWPPVAQHRRRRQAAVLLGLQDPDLELEKLDISESRVGLPFSKRPLSLGPFTPTLLPWAEVFGRSFKLQARGLESEFGFVKLPC